MEANKFSNSIWYQVCVLHFLLILFAYMTIEEKMKSLFPFLLVKTIDYIVNLKRLCMYL